MRDKENSKVEKTLMDLIDLSLSELGSISDEAKNHLISLAKEGAYFELIWLEKPDLWCCEWMKNLNTNLP